MSLHDKKELKCKTYDEMLDYILSYIQDRLKTSIDDLIESGINPNLLNRIGRLAKLAYNDLGIGHFTYDEMAELLETDKQISEYHYTKDHILFTFLKPEVELVDTEDGGCALSISMSIDYRYTDR